MQTVNCPKTEKQDSKTPSQALKPISKKIIRGRPNVISMKCKQLELLFEEDKLVNYTSGQDTEHIYIYIYLIKVMYIILIHDYCMLLLQ